MNRRLVMSTNLHHIRIQLADRVDPASVQNFNKACLEGLYLAERRDQGLGHGLGRDHECKHQGITLANQRDECLWIVSYQSD